MSEKKQQVLKSLKLNKLSENHLVVAKTMILIYQQVMEEIRS